MLQCVAARRSWAYGVWHRSPAHTQNSVLQCVAVCCSVWQLSSQLGMRCASLVTCTQKACLKLTLMYCVDMWEDVLGQKMFLGYWFYRPSEIKRPSKDMHSSELVLSVSLSLSLSLSFFLSLSLSFSLSLFLSFSLSLSLSLPLRLSLSISRSVALSLPLSRSLAPSRSLPPSLSLSPSPSLSLSLSLFSGYWFLGYWFYRPSKIKRPSKDICIPLS